MVGVASGALSAAEAAGILGDFVHSPPAEHRDRKLQRGGCLPVIVLNRLDPRIASAVKPSLCPISAPVEILL